MSGSGLYSDDVTKPVIQWLIWLNEEERCRFFDAVSENFCFHCGDRTPNHKCHGRNDV